MALRKDEVEGEGETVSSLMKPIKLLGMECPNRMVMSPMGRLRASDDHVPTDLMVEYYRQRASAGLIITGATSVSEMAIGYDNTPGLYTLAQVEAWKRVTDAVHEAGGRICAQLWHVGRISHPHFLKGALPIAPSAVKPAGMLKLLRPPQEYPVPKAATLEDIEQIVSEFKAAAANAKRAGFDGVCLHAANGYLIDQFLQDSTNLRTDEYGGSIENRCRFLWRVFDACTQVWGDSHKVAINISPAGDLLDMGDSDPLALFSHVVREAKRRRAGFIYVRLPRDKQETLGNPLYDICRPTEEELRGATAAGTPAAPPFIMNQQLDQAEAEKLMKEGHCDACGFGVLFIANPDLPARFRSGAELNVPKPATFHSGGAEGLIDYPTLKA